MCNDFIDSAENRREQFELEKYIRQGETEESIKHLA